MASLTRHHPADEVPPREPVGPRLGDKARQDDRTPADSVARASEASFPASDPPGWVGGAKAVEAPAAGPLVLEARTALDFMSTNLVAVRHDAAVQEASQLLKDMALESLPVIDGDGHPVGLIRQADILGHTQDHLRSLTASLGQAPGPSAPAALGPVQPAKPGDPILVRDVMTPTVLAVRAGTPAVRVVEEFLAQKARQLFVVDGTGKLVAVITPLDVLRRLNFDARG